MSEKVVTRKLVYRGPEAVRRHRKVVMVLSDDHDVKIKCGLKMCSYKSGPINNSISCLKYLINMKQ